MKINHLYNILNDILPIGGQSLDQIATEFATHFGIDKTEFGDYIKKGTSHYNEIREAIECELGEEYHEQYTGGAGIMTRNESALLYALVRASEPTTIVETGVAQGSSTSLVIHALEANGKGHLYSIDYPRMAAETRFEYQDGDFPLEGFDSAVIPEGKEPGWLVEDQLRDRWTLRIGRSTEHLPDLVKNKEVDFFIHDSEHTYKNILWELAIVAPSMSEMGWIWVDDSHWNDAFEHFSNGIAWPSFELENAGVIQVTEEFESSYSTNQ